MPPTPLVSVPSYSHVPNPNALDHDYRFTKKKTPSILVHYNAEPIDGSLNEQKAYIPPISSTTPEPPITTYKPFYSSTSTTTVLPPSSTAAYSVSTTPYSSTIPYSSTTPSSLFDSHPVSVPSKYFLPPFGEADDSPIIRIRPYNSPLPTPIAAYTIEQINNELQPPLLPSITLGDSIQNEVAVPLAFPVTIAPHNDPFNIVSSTIAPPLSLAENSLDSTKAAVPLFNRNSYYRGASRRPVSYHHQNHYYDHYDDKRPFKRYNSRIQNGFSYYLPRHYHEETFHDSGAQNRDGSFGYIDPFGIRRVRYYHVEPNTGFQTRDNNRYVGWDPNAKPYD